MKNIDGVSNTEKEKSPEKTESIPKTYDAIKNASGASTKPLGRKWSFFSDSILYITMVEAIANSVEDKLIDGLSFKMQPGAS